MKSISISFKDDFALISNEMAINSPHSNGNLHAEGKVENLFPSIRVDIKSMGILSFYVTPSGPVSHVWDSRMFSCPLLGQNASQKPWTLPSALTTEIATDKLYGAQFYQVYTRNCRHSLTDVCPHSDQHKLIHHFQAVCSISQWRILHSSMTWLSKCTSVQITLFWRTTKQDLTYFRQSVVQLSMKRKIDPKALLCEW